MIRRINSSEWLKRYNNMVLAEQKEYRKKVNEWLENESSLLIAHVDDDLARFMNAEQCSAGWNDATCEAFNNAARLSTALYGTFECNWLPEGIYTKSAHRVIRWLVGTLNQVVETGAQEGGLKPESEQKQPSVTPEKSAQGKPAPNRINPKTSPLPNSEGAGAGVRPVRPKHIDQYVHLLPEKTQEHAAEVKPLLTQLDEARENMRLLMEDKKASPADRERWAKLATKIDTRVRNIYKELDREWDKLVESGRVTVDDLGNARVLEAPKEKTENIQNDQEPEKQELTKEEKARVKVLRGFLKDTRRGNGRTRDEHIRKWKETYKEMVDLAGPDSVTDKVREAAQHYGIEIG